MRRAISLLSGAVIVTAGLTLAAPSGAGATTVTPGSFTGYGFDACTAPSQAKMDAWRKASPFRAIGVYISGGSRACKQPELTRDWVQTQAARGWKLTPIHVGYQAPCFPKSTKMKMSSNTATARTQGINSATQSVNAAKALGIDKKSYLYLDIEHYEISNTSCNDATLSFMEGWTDRIEGLGYRSGVYSSASAAIKALDQVKANPSKYKGYNLPGHLWFGWGNGKANTNGGKYLTSGGWRSHQRIHQYILDRTTSYAGEKIHIDYNFLDVGNGSRAPNPKGQCGTGSVNRYTGQRVGSKGHQVAVIKCLLKQQKRYKSPISQTYKANLARAVKRYQKAKGIGVTGMVNRRTWVSLLSQGSRPVLKFGHGTQSVYRVQRSLRASGKSVPVTGLYDSRTATAMRSYRKGVKLPQWGTAEPAVWAKLQAGRY